MMLRTTLLTALGASLLAIPAAHAQIYQGQVYSVPSYVAAAAEEDDETGAIGQDVPAGTVPGYNDPYAPGSRRGDYVQSTPMAPPAGAVQAPTYVPGTTPPSAPQTGYVSAPPGYQPGSQVAPGQPMAIAPGALPAPNAQQIPGRAYPQQGYPQQGYQQQAPQQQAYPAQGYPQQGYQQPTPQANGYDGSYRQDQLLQAARTGAVAPQASAQPGQPVYVGPTTAAYGQPGSAVRDAGAPPAGVYAPNAAVVPGTREAPSGPRIENVDPSEPVDARFQRQTVDYVTAQPAGTIVIDTPNTYLYYVLGGGKAIRYGIGVGRDGFTWSGTEKVTRKAEWADWRPPTEMIERQPYLPRFMAGGPGNPLGARTLYLGGTIYRIHGTNEPQTIGKFVSSGCFRMLNADVEDLFERVKVGTKVVIMPKTGNAQANAASGKPQAPTPR
ncbi:L,D-transpeptidase family protein [Aquabacter sp. CN5-332]|uniref:L,D-transpeptidase n=1 Tax=Aquabacter sp. CN5-332 TaxID=3156608 RepID=UPI0032B573E2